MKSLRRHLVTLPRLAKLALLVAGDGTLIVGCLVFAAWYNGLGAEAVAARGWGQFLLAPVLGLGCLAGAGWYRALMRYDGQRARLGGLLGMTIVALVMIGVRDLTASAAFDLARPVIIGFWLTSIVALRASRWIMVAFLAGPRREREPVIVYGAGVAGAKLVAAMAVSQRFRVVAVVDDDPQLHGRELHGARIVGPDELVGLVGHHGVRRVLVALPAASRHQRNQVIDRLADLAVHVQTVPDIATIVAGRARVDDLQEVDALDVLGREPVAANEQLLDRCVRGKVVMVTGAGGSIGSELCRQIIALGARRLVLFEISEHALYRIDHELRVLAVQRDYAVEIVALLGSVHHLDRVHSIMTAFGVQTVYHAAAYKHVPIVETNMVEGIHNNIIGTWHAAEAAEAAGVETFVLISTDKAVNPVNIMGATKRFAELVLQGMTQRGAHTRFCMVRFGNVLESSGSVVPLFREQIRTGGPVTVTHPEVVRYFMTIPEAAALVIQAGSMGAGGDVFLLDMGEPVRIADLARRMIRLSGNTVRDEANPHGTIPILCTGLRPGEKLYEELLIGGNCAGTDHPRIMRAVEESLPWVRVRSCLGQFLAAANTFDCQHAQNLLLDAVAGYRPLVQHTQDLVWGESAGSAVLPDRTPMEASLRLIAGQRA